MVDLVQVAERRAAQAAAARRFNDSMRRLGRAFALGTELDRVRRRATHFKTPRVMRPYWRLRAWLVLREIRRNAAA